MKHAAIYYIYMETAVIQIIFYEKFYYPQHFLLQILLTTSFSMENFIILNTFH